MLSFYIPSKQTIWIARALSGERQKEESLRTVRAILHEETRDCLYRLCLMPTMMMRFPA
jgi:hypothetical protein